MKQESHISSLIIHCKEHCIKTVSAQLEKIDLVEIAITSEEQSKLIVVLDTPNTKAAEHLIDQIKKIEHVVSAILVYHHVEPDTSLNAPIQEHSDHNIPTENIA